MTNAEIRAKLDAVRAAEPPELREVLDWGRAQNAKRFKCVDGVVQFRGDFVIRKES